MPIFIVRKPLHSADKDAVRDENFLTIDDKKSEMRKSGKSLDSSGSEHAPATGNVHFISKLSEPEKIARLSVQHDCDTLSDMALREKYRLAANSHRNMLYREKQHKRTVNKAWKKFRDFLRSEGSRSKNLSIDRINNPDTEYAPGKVRWATRRTQSNNRSNTKVFVHSVTGEKWTASDLAKRERISISAIHKRASRDDWTPDEIIEGGRRPRLPQAVPSEFIPIPQNASDVPKPAKPPHEKLADLWEGIMRELRPERKARLTGFELGRINEFAKCLDENGLHSDKTGRLEFILRQWYCACEYVSHEIGRKPLPNPEPDFLARHARHFIDFLFAHYKPESLWTLNVTNEDKPTPLKGGLQIKKTKPKPNAEDMPTLEEILAKP